MASTTSTAASYATARSSFSYGEMWAMTLFVPDVDYPESWDPRAHGYAETISSDTSSSHSSNAASSVPSGAKQASSAPGGSSILTWLGRAWAGSAAPPPVYQHPNAGNLSPDHEGTETKAQMLKRRRLECAAEEVDVALAPVYKINVPYVFYPEQYRRFRSIFPRVTPDSGLSFVHHDHPVAHTATLLGIRHMQSYLKTGMLACDINGNPTSNESFNHFQSRKARKAPNGFVPPGVDTFVSVNSPIDAVRKVSKWGPEFDPDGNRRWHKGNIADVPSGVYDMFFMVHTLYYHSLSQISELLNSNPGKPLLALVNYAPEQTGTLYGELKFTKQDGFTTQVSPNGEKYSHPDIDGWFQTNSYRGITERVGGLAWTTRFLGGHSYLIYITACPWENATRTLYHAPAAPAITIGRGGLHFAWVRIGDRNVSLRITNVAFAQELRHYMTLRARDADGFKSLCVKARRFSAKDLATDSRQYEVGDGELSDHIVYAFLVDAPGELELLEGVKLLRGSLLQPHLSALKLEGDDKIYGVFRSVLNIFCRPPIKQALLPSKHGTKAAPKTNMVSGLLPTQRG